MVEVIFVGKQNPNRQPLSTTPGTSPDNRDFVLEMLAMVAYRTRGILGGNTGPTVLAAIVMAEA